MCRAIGPQVLQHFEKEAKPWGGRCLLEEMHHCWQALKLYGIFKNGFILCLWVLWMYPCMWNMHVWCQQRSEKGIRYPGPGVRNVCEPLWGSWDPNSGPSQEQQELLTNELALCLLLRLHNMTAISQLKLLSPHLPHHDRIYPSNRKPK